MAAVLGGAASGPTRWTDAAAPEGGARDAVVAGAYAEGTEKETEGGGNTVEVRRQGLGIRERLTGWGSCFPILFAKSAKRMGHPAPAQPIEAGIDEVGAGASSQFAGFDAKRDGFAFRRTHSRGILKENSRECGGIDSGGGNWLQRRGYRRCLFECSLRKRPTPRCSLLLKMAIYSRLICEVSRPMA